jgi:hypothetical protein
MFSCLMLLTLGIASGLFALFLTPEPGTADEPAPWGISSRGWVSLTLLALAGVLLVAQEARVLGPLAGKTVAAEPVAGAANSPAVGTRGPEKAGPAALAQQPTVWNMWPRRIDSAEARRGGTTVSARPSNGSPPGTDLGQGLRPRPGPGIVASNDREDEKARLQREVQERLQRIAALEASTNAAGARDPAPPPRQGGPEVVDLAGGVRGRPRTAATSPRLGADQRSGGTATFPVVDVSRGIRGGR